MRVAEESTIAQEPTQRPQQGQQPLSAEEAGKLAGQVPDWMLQGNQLERDFKFADFNEAIEFVNEVARVASSADHHPDIQVSYNKVHLTLSTHKIGGLSRNDFIVAARIDDVL